MQKNKKKEIRCDTNGNEYTMRSRKRKRQSALLKPNLRKRRRQSSVDNINTRGNTQQKREVKIGTKDCNAGGWRIKCSNNVSETKRKAIVRTFKFVLKVFS